MSSPDLVNIESLHLRAHLSYARDLRVAATTDKSYESEIPNLLPIFMGSRVQTARMLHKKASLAEANRQFAGIIEMSGHAMGMATARLVAPAPNHLRDLFPNSRPVELAYWFGGVTLEMPEESAEDKMARASELGATVVHGLMAVGELGPYFDDAFWMALAPDDTIKEAALRAVDFRPVGNQLVYHVENSAVSKRQLWAHRAVIKT